MPEPDSPDSQSRSPAAGLARYGSALLESGRLLLLSCPDGDELERQARHLMVWLRHHQPALAVEHLDRLDSDEVVQRMNRLLTEHSLKDATRAPEAGPIERLWVLHDPLQAQTHELLLLTRVLQQFPGARLSALLLTEQPERFAALQAERPRGLLHCALPGRLPAAEPPRTAVAAQPTAPSPALPPEATSSAALGTAPATAPATAPVTAPVAAAAAASTPPAAGLERARAALAQLAGWRPAAQRLQRVLAPLAQAFTARLAQAWKAVKIKPLRARRASPPPASPPPDSDAAPPP